MLEKFSKEKTDARLRQIGTGKSLLFGLMTVDRMLPNYLRFAAEVGAAGGCALEEIILSIWSRLEGQSSISQLRWSVKDIEFLIPESEVFDSIYTAAATDAAVATANILEFLETKKIALISEVASLSHDTVDIFLQYKEEVLVLSPDVEKFLQTHPLMQKELAMQSDDLDHLTFNEFETVQSLASLRLRLRERGGIGMVR